MEQALVLASIVLGVAIAFELEHLNKVLRSKNVRWHWAQPLFALFVLLTIIAFWWGAASWVDDPSRADEPFSLGRFLPMMFQLVLLALLAAASFPDHINEAGLDLAEYYQDNSKYQWTLMTLYLGSIHVGYAYNVAQSVDTLGVFLARVVPDTLLASVVIVMIFAKRWWQVALGFAALSIAPLIWMTRTLG